MSQFRTVDEEFAKARGFESFDEFLMLASRVDHYNPTTTAALKMWLYNNGTKEGLLRLIKKDD